jgi:hypothetical protein
MPTEKGISTGGRSKVSIEGPGRVVRFATGVEVSGATNSITGALIGGNCGWGVLVTGTGNTLEGKYLITGLGPM